MKGITMRIIEKKIEELLKFILQVWKISFKLLPLLVKHKCTLLMKLFITALNLSGVVQLILE